MSELNLSDKLYNMGLGDETRLEVGTYAFRVPGGWIFWKESENGAGGWNMTSCFVPFDNEFMSVQEDV